MNNYLVRAASMEGVRATIASLGGDADAVHFPHAPPDNLHPYRRVFDCRLVFNADSLQMIFRADILDRPLNNADPRLHRLLEEHLSSLRSAYPDDYCGQVRHLISQALTTGASNNFSLARPSGILLPPAKNRTGEAV